MAAERDERQHRTDDDDAPVSVSGSINEAPAEGRRHVTNDDFLIPGPTPESNEGMARWGLTWLVFSIVLMVLMALLSFVCLTLATWTGLA